MLRYSYIENDKKKPASFLKPVFILLKLCTTMLQPPGETVGVVVVVVHIHLDLGQYVVVIFFISEFVNFGKGNI